MTTREGYEPGEFCWVDLMSHGMGDAKKFYAEMFGWTTREEDTQGGPPYAQFHKDGKTVAGLGEANDEMKSAGVPPVWNNYVRVDDCQATENRAKELGAEITVPTMQVVDAGWLAFLTDPDGATFALWQPNAHQGAQLVDEAGSFSWNELMTRDPAAAKEFYGSLFGWQFDDQDMGGMTYTIIKRGESMAGGMMQIRGDMKGVPPHWLTYFTVPSCDAAVDKCQQIGGKVLVPQMDIPPGRFAIVTDAQGAAFAVFEMAE